MSDQTEPGGRAADRGLGHHVRSHARGLSAVAVASAVGILASFAFQILSARYLAPADFGLLSAFFVIVNVAAIGSSSLQNSVTVHTAAELSAPDASPRRRRWPVDALVLGLVGGLLVAAAAPWLAASLDTTAAVVIAAAVTVPLSFVFADALGLLQGSGSVAQAVWWSTIAQVARVALALIAVIVATGLVGIIGAVVVAIALAVAGAVWAARRTPRPRAAVFSVAGITIVVLTVAFAWLTASDVIFLRAGAPETVAGMYASVTVLVKTGFLLPATLSLYLLPRFVRNRGNISLSRLGVLVTLLLSVATGLTMIAVFAVLGPWLIVFLYGAPYADAAALLVPTALAYLPWIAAQGMLIKMTSSASIAASSLLVVAVAAQWLWFTLTVPDVAAMLAGLGALGVVVLAGFLVIDVVAARRTAAR